MLNTYENVEIKRQQCVVMSLKVIRVESASHLPIGHSFIPYDILVTIVEHFTNNKELTVKALFASLPYSDMGLRYHFRKLVQSGWIELHAIDGDARVKQIKPTEKLTKHFEMLSQSIAPLLNIESFEHDS